MPTREIVEVIAAGIMALCLLLVVGERIYSRRGFGARVVQFLAVGLLIASILILALEEVLATETTAALIGAITGYLLSGIGNQEPSAKKKSPTQESPSPDEAPSFFRAILK